MTDQLGSSNLHVLFEIALQDYEKQTGIALAKHPLAERLQNCGSVESVTVVLHEQTQTFSEFRGKEKTLRLLKNAVSVLYKLSSGADFGQAISLVRPWLHACAFNIPKNIPDPHIIAYPARESNIHWPRYPTFCMFLSFSKRASS